MKSILFSSQLQQDKDETWWFVHVPKDIRDNLKHLEKRGIIHVSITLGNTSWNGSMLPWADGSAQISINKAVRTKEDLQLGDILSLTITPRK